MQGTSAVLDLPRTNIEFPAGSVPFCFHFRCYGLFAKWPPFLPSLMSTPALTILGSISSFILG